MQASHIKKMKEKFYLGPKVRICTECGEKKVDIYEYGISCESCGAGFVFGQGR